jgi:hypothetical protein
VKVLVTKGFTTRQKKEAMTLFRAAVISGMMVALAATSGITPASAASYEPATCVTFIREFNAAHQTIYVNSAAFGGHACLAKDGPGGYRILSQANHPTGAPKYAASSRRGCTWGTGGGCTVKSGFPVTLRRAGRESFTFRTSGARIASGSNYDLGADDFYGHGNPRAKGAEPTTELMVIMRSKGKVLAKGGTRVTIAGIRYIVKTARTHPAKRIQFVRVNQTTSLSGFKPGPLERYAVRHGWLSRSASLWYMSGIFECFNRGRGYRTISFEARA